MKKRCSNIIANNIIDEMYNDSTLFCWNNSKSKFYLQLMPSNIKKKISILLKDEVQSNITMKLKYNYQALFIIFWHSPTRKDKYIKTLNEILYAAMWILYNEFNHSSEYQYYIRIIINYRAIIHQCKSIEDYKKYAISSKKELKFIASAFTPSTTYFFRDNLDSEITAIIPKVKEKLKILIIWCSTWSEVYSVTYILHKLDIPFQLLATDINEKALLYAKNGIYDYNIINQINNQARISELFTHKWEVRKRYRTNIVFKQLNIIKDTTNHIYDIIIARNIIKYFNEADKNLCFQKIWNILKSNWILIVWTQKGTNKDINPKKYIKCYKIWDYSYQLI